MSQNATNLWNLLAPGLSFYATTAPQIGPGTKFSEAYQGQNFAADFNQIVQGINAGLGTDASVPPGYSGDDLMIASLLKFPPPSLQPPH